MRWILALAMWVGMTGCSTVTAPVMLSPVESPEGIGEGGRFTAGFGGSPAVLVAFTEDASSRPPDLTKKNIDNGSIATANLGVGVLSRVDGFIKTSLSNQWIYGLRWQLLGPSRYESKEGDWSAAIIGTWFRGQVNKSGDQKGTFGPGGFNWDSSVVTTQQDVAFMVGRRLSELWLVYLGPGYSSFEVSGNIHHALSSDLSSPEANYPLSAAGTIRGLRLGLQFESNKRTQVAVEGNYSDVVMPDFRSRTYFGFGLRAEVGL